MRRALMRCLCGSLPFLLLLVPHDAAAEETKQDAIDGFGACSAFEAKNDKELADWEKAQPVVKYKYDRPDTVGGAPWGKFLSASGSIGDLLLATLLPQFGAEYRAEAPALLLSWPMQIPFGPAETCTRKQGSFRVDESRPNRLLIEPGLVASKAGSGPYVRPGYRFLYQPSDWVVGAGLGVGSRIELAGNREPFRASASGEVVIRFGHCCEPDYFTLVFRFDHFLAGTSTNIFGGALGFTYF